MATMWRKAMLYLGLGPDDEYDDFDAADERVATPEPAPAPAPAAKASAPREPATVTTRPAPRPRPAPARPVSRPAPSQPSPPVSTAPSDPFEGSAVRTLPAPGSGEPATPLKPRGVVRPVAANTAAKPHVVSPSSFNQAQDVADKFKASQPVILNLQGVDRDLSRRLIDFSSGLCYGLGGHMEKVANAVYLLTPSNVELSAEERRRLQERGLHDA